MSQSATSARVELNRYLLRINVIKDEVDELQAERVRLELRVSQLRRNFFPEEVDE